MNETANKGRVVVLNDTSYENHHGCQLVMRHLRAGLAGEGLTVVNSGQVGRDWRDNPKLVSDIKNCHLLVVNGEGTIHHDLPAAKGLVAAATFAHQHQIPAVLINATWSGNSRELAAEARLFKKICVRETGSQRELAAHSVAAEVVPDLTFMTGNFQDQCRERSGVILTDSVYDEVSELLLAHVRSTSNCSFRPLLAPYCIRQVNAKSVIKKVKYLLHDKFGGLYESLHLNRQHYRSMKYIAATPELLIAQMHRSRLVVSARFHGNCFALKSLTPFVAITSNTHKVEGLIRDVGLNRERILPVAGIDLAEQIACWQERGFSDEELERLRVYLAGAEAKIAAMFKGLAALTR